MVGNKAIMVEIRHEAIRATMYGHFLCAMQYLGLKPMLGGLNFTPQPLGATED